MSLFDKIFRPREESPRYRAAESTFKTLTAYTPVFTSWGGKIYESEIVRAAIDARARHISKLRVDVIGSAQPRLQTILKKEPNAFQTWSQFLYRVSTILDVNNNAFIVPVIDEYGNTAGFFPVLPSRCEIVQYNNVPYLRYEFRSGDKASVELSRCGILTRHQYESDFFGATNNALRPTMELINIQEQGIKEGVKSSATFRFMATLNNFAKPEDLKKERERFTESNLKADSGGVLLFPNNYTNVKQIDAKPFVVDAAQMEAINRNVYDYFGVNEKILQNSATADELDAFYNGCIEPFAIQLSEVLTKMVFTYREKAEGAEIIVNANRLQYMSTANKIALATNLGDRGMILIDEIRDLFNYPPLPDGAGQKAPIRGEYYMIGETDNAGTGN